MYWVNWSSNNKKLNVLRLLVCLRIPEVSVERITVCNVIEKLAKHDILFLATLGKPPIPTLFKFWPLLLNLISKDTNRKILAK